MAFRVGSPFAALRSDSLGRGGLRCLLPYLWPPDRRDLRRRVVLSAVFLLSGKAAALGVPFIYKTIIDALTGAAPASPAQIVAHGSLIPFALVVGYGVGRVLSGAFAQLRDGCLARVTQYAARDFTNRLFRCIHRLPLAFHLERKTGELAQIVERAGAGVETFLRYSLFSALPTLIEIALVAVIMGVYLGAWFSFIVLLMLGAYAVFTFRATEWRSRIRKRMNEARGRLGALLVDGLLNYETVKSFAAEDHEAERYDRANADYQARAIALTHSLAALNVGQAAISAVGMTAAMTVALILVGDGTLTLGDFVMVNALLIQLQSPLSFLGTLYRDAKQSLIDLDKAAALLDAEAQTQLQMQAKRRAATAASSPSGAAPDRRRGGVLRFEGVCFSYGSAAPVLDGVDFTIRPGERVGLAGVSGCGKSTLIRLLFRFYEPDAGRISLDGIDIATLDIASWRAVLALVPQDTALFNETLRYNVAYGRPEAPFSAIEAAYRLSRLDALIARLPEGDGAVVGERGLKLSGGERQRVGLARAVLKEAPIHVFDEATSALDLAAEREIHKTLCEVSRGRTTLTITHRLSELTDLDRILVLDGGRIVEDGDHASLLARDGVYARLQRSLRREDGVDRPAAARPVAPPKLPKGQDRP